MTLKEFESLMVKHGAVIRALPEKTSHWVEKRHIDRYPNAEVRFIPEYNREMLLVEEYPTHGGQFVVELVRHTCSTVRFEGRRFFKTLDEVADYLAGLEEVQEK